MDSELRKLLVQAILAILIYGLESGLAVQFFKRF